MSDVFVEGAERGLYENDEYEWTSTHGYDTKHDTFRQWLGGFPAIINYLEENKEDDNYLSKLFYICYKNDRDADWKKLHLGFLRLVERFPPNDNFDHMRLVNLIKELDTVSHISLIVSFEILRFVDVFLWELGANESTSSKL